MNAPDVVDNWERNPSQLTITRNNSDSIITLPKIPYVWRNNTTGDLLVISDWGIGGEYDIWHIPEQYITPANKWLKKARLQNDKAKYSHGKVIARSRDEQDILKTAIDYMKNK